MERKLYPCGECGREVPIRSKGKCPLCRAKEMGVDKPKKTYYIPQRTEKNKEKRKRERECLGDFFEVNIEELKKYPYSNESGDYIIEPSSLNIAHLLPKSRYKSVQCHPNNCMYYTWNEHSKFDNLLDKREFEKLEKEFPNSWRIVCDKMEELLPLIKETGKFKTAIINYLGL